MRIEITLKFGDRLYIKESFYSDKTKEEVFVFFNKILKVFDAFKSKSERKKKNA